MMGWLNQRGAKSLAALAAIAALCLNLAAALAIGRPAQAQTQNRAGLVVAYANGAIETRCVTFNEPSITGYELVRRSGLPFSAQVSGLGAAMCKIGDEGCSYPAQSCFCKCENPASGCGYWIYGQWSGSAWRYAGMGAIARTISDGQIDGWVWDVVSADAAAVRLPPVTLAQICAPQAAPILSAPTRSAPTLSAPTRVAVTPPPATRAPATLAPPPFTPTPQAQAAAVSTAANVAPVVAPATATFVASPTPLAVVASANQPASTVLPTSTELPAISIASPAPTATISPIVNASAASGEGIAGFLGIMALLGGIALVWQRLGLRGGRR